MTTLKALITESKVCELVVNPTTFKSLFHFNVTVNNVRYACRLFNDVHNVEVVRVFNLANDFVGYFWNLEGIQTFSQRHADLQIINAIVKQIFPECSFM